MSTNVSAVQARLAGGCLISSADPRSSAPKAASPVVSASVSAVRARLEGGRFACCWGSASAPIGQEEEAAEQPCRADAPPALTTCSNSSSDRRSPALRDSISHAGETQRAPAGTCSSCSSEGAAQITCVALPTSLSRAPCLDSSLSRALTCVRGRPCDCTSATRQPLKSSNGGAGIATWPRPRFSPLESWLAAGGSKVQGNYAYACAARPRAGAERATPQPHQQQQTRTGAVSRARRPLRTLAAPPRPASRAARVTRAAASC